LAKRSPLLRLTVWLPPFKGYKRRGIAKERS
jgi:hypothetical protein